MPAYHFAGSSVTVASCGSGWGGGTSSSSASGSPTVDAEGSAAFREGFEADLSRRLLLFDFVDFSIVRLLAECQLTRFFADCARSATSCRGTHFFFLLFAAGKLQRWSFLAKRLLRLDCCFAPLMFRATAFRSLGYCRRSRGSRDVRDRLRHVCCLSLCAFQRRLGLPRLALFVTRTALMAARRLWLLRSCQAACAKRLGVLRAPG